MRQLHSRDANPRQATDDRIVAAFSKLDRQLDRKKRRFDPIGNAVAFQRLANMQRFLAWSYGPDAGPYISRRERWILRQVRAEAMHQSGLAKLAAAAAEYRSLKQVPKCVAHDLAKLVSRGLIRRRAHGGYWVSDDAGGSGGTAQASTPP